MTKERPHCGAKYFKQEHNARRKYTKCCMEGKIALPPIQPPSPSILGLFELITDNSWHFLANLRQYNSMMAFASWQAQLRTHAGRGVPVITIHGKAYHMAGVPEQNENRTAQYADLYIMDTCQAMRQRVDNNQNLKENIIQLLQNELMAVNPVCAALSGNGRYFGRAERPSSSKQQTNTDFQDGSHRQAKSISEEILRKRANSRPNDFPLPFFYGERGYNVDIPRQVTQDGHQDKDRNRRTRVSLNEFYAYRIQVRNAFSALNSASLLFQQYLVGAYTKIEGNTLNWILRNQQQLRVDSYQGLMDHLNRRANTEMQMANALNPNQPVEIQEDKPRTAEQIDNLILAEIPNKQQHPRYRKLVKTHMMHGPCGHLNPRLSNCETAEPNEHDNNQIERQQLAIGLLEDDAEHRRCMAEAALFNMPSQSRELFATLLMFQPPSDLRALFNEFVDVMSEDFVRQKQVTDATVTFTDRHMYQCLLDIDNALHAHGHSINNYPDLPHLPTNFFIPTPDADQIDIITEQQQGLEMLTSLNPEQLEIHTKVIEAVQNQSEQNCYFLDGPAGTGKTFLYNTLVHSLQFMGNKVQCMVWSGIAATLLINGRTSHSTFQIPIPLLPNSTCNIKMIQSARAQMLRNTTLFIWDEASMIPGNALRAVDTLLRDITEVKRPFGGKFMLLGGDFRQVVPVIIRAGREQIVAESLKSMQIRDLWGIFEQHHLHRNMRAIQDATYQEFSEWLL
eukprot:gene11547-biopygen9217